MEEINTIPEDFGLHYKTVMHHLESIKQYEDLQYSHLTKKEREFDIKPVRNSKLEPKINRNETCLCGSGKKYKHCCLSL